MPEEAAWLQEFTFQSSYTAFAQASGSLSQFPSVPGEDVSPKAEIWGPGSP